MRRKISAVITDILGDRIVIIEESLHHAMARHFPLIPQEIVLELIERVLKDPTDIFKEEKKHTFHLFYKFDNRHFIVVIVKQTSEGSFFVTVYPTGMIYRKKHRKLKRVRYEKS